MRRLFALAERTGKQIDGGAAAGRALIACAMMEDEVRAALERCGVALPVTWIDRGYHSKPEVLREKVQERIEEAERAGAGEVLLALGLCGCGAVGLHTERAVLAMPRFDDCVNLMLCTGERTSRGFAEAGVMYLTRGWSSDASLIVGQRELYRRKYGDRRADRLMRGMYGSYRAVSLIDNGCYDLQETREYAQRCADTIGVEVRTDPGSNIVLEKLVSGAWDDDILVCGPGRPVQQEDFDYEVLLDAR